MKRDSLTNWREKLGLSQQGLADYLGISRGLVNLVERGERELPTQALVLFSQLLRNYEAALLAQVPAERSQAARQKSLTTLNEVIAETTWQLTKLRQELATIEADYERTLYQMQAFQVTRQQLAASANADRERQLLWLTIKEDEAGKKMESTSPDARLPLQIKMASLKASLGEAQTLREAMVVEEE